MSNDLKEYQDKYVIALKKAMITMLTLKGNVNDNNLIYLKKVFLEATGAELMDVDIEKELEIANKIDDSLSIAFELEPILSETGKEHFVEYIHKIALADKSIDDAEKTYLRELADALSISSIHYSGIWMHLSNLT